MNKKKLRLAVIQMDCEVKNKALNMKRAMEFVDRVEANTDIVCLPEFFSTGYNLDLIGADYFDLAETVPGETTAALGRKAAEKGIAIVGNIVEKDKRQESVLYDTAFVIDNKGNFKGKYRKYNLYPTEHSYFRPGSDISVVDLGGIKIGMAICFDHAFPELFRLLALQGAQIIVIPSAIPKGYAYLLNLRTRARAQDNQVFVVAANRVGREETVEYCGLSKVVDPRGEILVEASGEKEEIISAEIELDRIAEERKSEPVLRSLRRDLLKSVYELSAADH
ncbi:MAG: carbon-nitrogen hydrolase family protein [Spirochaetota bacterium]|nr:carbon-nitrogen hydrolase family protein [Spirochaetota bacterium]